MQFRNILWVYLLKKKDIPLLIQIQVIKTQIISTVNMVLENIMVKG